MFRWADCMEGHIVLGFALNVVSFVLLLLTAFSNPYIQSIYFLESQYGVKYGAFGYCEPEPAGCIGSTVGYDTGPEVIEWMTRTHILFPTAAAFMLLSLVALILSLLKVGKFMWEPRYFRTTALIGSLSAIVAEVFALICWVTARHRFDQNDDPGRATYGAALWLGLVGAITGFISACIGGPAYNGNYGMHWANRDVAYNV